LDSSLSLTSVVKPDLFQPPRALPAITMLSIILPFSILFASISNAYLVPRDATPICTDLRANSNNGDRKIALVIDSSGSMETSDPYQYRLAAGKMAIDWLISTSEVTSSQKQDEVTVINFDDQAYLDYPLGDPGAAASALDGIGADGGTYIAGGVEMAIAQLTANGTGDTSGGTGMLVFTDGQVWFRVFNSRSPHPVFPSNNLI
jgi:Mg-chelatase subunit ChlD